MTKLAQETGKVQLSRLLQDHSPDGVITEVRKIFCYHYPDHSFNPIEQSYMQTKALYGGDFPGYRSCNTHYHNFAHSVDTLLASARLLDGYNLIHEPLPKSLAVKLMNSALLHDTGYIQEVWDIEGTGAKYTTSHVARSAQFLQKNRKVFKISPNDAKSMGNLIWCTDLNVEIGSIDFADDDEKWSGFILGTADLLCQMADRAYMEKLVYLYDEFKEGGVPGFDVEYDIIRKTVDFYGFMKIRFAETLSDARKYAQPHFQERFAIDDNLYVEAIERHMAYLRGIIEDGNPDFRGKLKRWNCA